MVGRPDVKGISGAQAWRLHVTSGSRSQRGGDPGTRPLDDVERVSYGAARGRLELFRGPDMLRGRLDGLVGLVRADVPLLALRHDPVRRGIARASEPTGYGAVSGPGRSRVHPAFLQVELALEVAQDVVVDLALGAQPNERLALRPEHGPPDLAVLDELAVFSVTVGLLALAIDVLRAVLVGRAQLIEKRPMSGPHLVELVQPPGRGVEQTLPGTRLLLT